MNFIELKDSAENNVDRSIIGELKKQSEHTFIKKVGRMVSTPVNKYNYLRGTDSKLRNWSDDAFGGFATYAFFLYRFQRTLIKSGDIEKTIHMLMESLAGNLIEEHPGLELEKTLGFMQENMGISKGFHRALTEYFIDRKKVISALQWEYPQIDKELD